MIFYEPKGTTPPDPEEAAGLRLSNIVTCAEFNRWEQEDIATSEAWAFARRRRKILDEGFTPRLHKRISFISSYVPLPHPVNQNQVQCHSG